MSSAITCKSFGYIVIHENTMHSHLNQKSCKTAIGKRKVNAKESSVHPDVIKSLPTQKISTLQYDGYH